jgi:hypothetical protein
MSLWNQYRAKLGQPEPHLLAASPRFFIAGLPKTATTWLFEILGKHPDFYIRPEKEARYFCQLWRNSDINWYLRAHIDGIGKIIGDATLTYSILPPSALSAIAAILPETKVIILLRDPVERFLSHLRHQWYYGEGDFYSFGRAYDQVDIGQWRRAACHPLIQLYSNYRLVVENMERAFGPDRVFIGLQEEIWQAPSAFLNRLTDFLGINPLQIDESQLRARVNDRVAKDLPDELAGHLYNDHRDLLERNYAFIEERFGRSLVTPQSKIVSAQSASPIAPWSPIDTVSRDLFGNMAQMNGDQLAQACVDFFALSMELVPVYSPNPAYQVWLKTLKFYAIPLPDRPETMSDEELSRHFNSRERIVADSYDELAQKIG